LHDTLSELANLCSTQLQHSHQTSTQVHNAWQTTKYNTISSTS
jgi:hypothetical protein